jgi:hypothetical protein
MDLQQLGSHVLSCYEHRPLWVGACLGGAALAHKLSFCILDINPPALQTSPFPSLDVLVNSTALICSVSP